MPAGGNPLLRPGAEAEWARIDAEERRSLARPHETVAQRLLRGQRLSAQAAALRRSVRDDRPAHTFPASTTSLSMAPNLVDIRSAAALTGRHPETVRRWVWSGKLRAQRRGNRLLVDRTALEALAGRGKAVKPGLAAWRDRAKATRREESNGVASGSAAALVIGDHRERSGGPLPAGS